MEEILAKLNDILADTEISRRAINNIKSTIDKAESAIAGAKEGLSEKAYTRSADMAFQESLSMALEESSNIFQEEVQIATAISPEYNYSEFKNSLLDIADINGLFKYSVHGAGWSRNITLDIDMDGAAGSIEDYATAVELARGALGVGQGKDPSKASDIWRTKVYPSSLYDKTMKLRFQYFGSPAPYWSLLNYGNKSVSMSSDWGGTPYPTCRPTRFVEHSKDRVYKLFRTYFMEKKAVYFELIANLKAKVEELVSKVTAAKGLVSELELNFDMAKSIARQLGISIKDVDINKLLAATQIARGGNAPSRLSIGGGRRISSRKLAGLNY
jgi:hypothetical protein